MDDCKYLCLLPGHGLNAFQEYQENESALTVENVEINQTVNLYGCKSSTIIIKGKVNAVTLG